MLKLFDWWSEFSWINWHFVKNISCVFVNVHSWKYGNVSLFEFFYIFQCFQAPVQYCRVMLKLFDWWSKFAWITTHIVKNISCVFVTVRSRKYGDLSLFEFFYISQCFQASVPHCEVMLKLFDWWSEFSWINWHFVKNISCVFVKVQSRKYGNVSLLEFFYIFQCFQASVQYCRVQRKLFAWWNGFAWIKWHFVENITCVFVNVHSWNMETFLCLNSFTFFNVFKHQFSTVEFNQNHLIDEVSLHG